MNHKKDSFEVHQDETVIIEIAVWVILFGFLYMCSKGIVLSGSLYGCRFWWC